MKTLLHSTIVLLLTTIPLVSCQKEDCEFCNTNPTSQTNGTLKADAGPDNTIMLPQDSVVLDGTSSTNAGGVIISYEWSRISGPNSFEIVNKKATKTIVKSLIAGNYTFSLNIMDAAGRVAKDAVQITVIPALVSESCTNQNRPMVKARLIPVGTLSEARAGMTVVATGDKIFFAGAELSEAGFNGYGSTRVDIFDTVAKTWSKANLSEARSDIAAVAAGNKIFFAGGRLGDGAFDQLFATVDIYDIETNSWSVSKLSEPRAYIAAATVGNKVFFAGGEKNWNYETSDKVDIYDLSTNTWSTAFLSQPRSHIAAVTANNKIYFAGGHKDDRWYENPSDKFDVFDNTTNSWTKSFLSKPMGFVAAIALADNIYWMGGCTMETKNINTWKSSIDYLFKPDNWTYDKKIALKDNKLIYFRNGGEDANKFDIYDLNTKTWSIGVLENEKIQYQTIISVNNTIYLAGGRIPSDNSLNLSNQVWKLEF